MYLFSFRGRLHCCFLLILASHFTANPGWPQTADTPDATRRLAAGLEPAAAAAAMTLRDGFRAQLVAGEPDVHQPVAMTIDHRGRLWVAEAHTYPIRAPDGQGRDKIVIFEDTDSDGRFESRKLFASGLNLISGLEVGFGGVWVGAAPYLLFIPDKDGDDQPDTDAITLLDGFGYQDTHETLNAFVWGPDGWLYGCHGVFTHSLVGKPGTPADQRNPVNAAVWRYHPLRHEFEVFCRGTSNPWGLDFNDQGHAFITACVIPHLWHVIQGARYHRQGGQHFNPYLFDDIKTIARHRHYAGDIRDHAWWGNEPETPLDTLAAGGGHAHCGAMIYLGDNWPDDYRNQIFMHNVHGNRVNQDRLYRDGSGYAGDRAPDLMLANDKWFRGINLRYGPDGTVYLIDWYDRNACHRATPEIWDRTNGRIYNLSYGANINRVKVDLASMTNAQLVELQLAKNDWYVRTARRILQHRAADNPRTATDVDQRLWQLATTHESPSRRLRATWTLHAMRLLTPDRIATLLADSDENVRAWAIQLELEDHKIPASNLHRIQAMAKSDSSQLVRLYLASALQRLPIANRWQLAQDLLSHAEDADDHNLPLLIWYGIEPLVPTDVARGLELVRFSQIPLVSDFIVRRAAAYDDGLESLIQWAVHHDGVIQSRVLDQVLIALEGRVEIAMPNSWTAAYDQLIANDDLALRDKADQVAMLLGDRRVFPRMRELLLNEVATMQRRRSALSILVRAQDKDASPALQAALAEPALRADALRALGNLDDPRTAEIVIRMYAELTDAERRNAIGTLTSRASYASSLLDAIQRNEIPTKDLHAYNVRQILSLGDPSLRERLKETWGEVRESSSEKRNRVAELTEVCTPRAIQAADAGRGRWLYDQHCASCHRLFGKGGEVGPDITGSNRTNLQYILENMVDPSAVVGKDYQMTVFELNDGRVVSGLVEQETDSAVRVRTLNDSVLIAKSAIDQREESPLSMMPEGLLDRLEPQQIRDLVAYLASPSQVPVADGPTP